MAKALFANAASALLAASIDDNDLTIQVDSGYGALFPNPSGGDYFIVTLRNAAGDIEYCKVTSRTADLLTVPSGGRGFDGSSAQSWTNGQTRVELRMTKAYEEVFIQRGGDAMDGDLDMNGNDVIDAVLSGSSTQITAGQIIGVPLRGAVDDSSNEIAVPSDGSRATAGGDAILTEGDAQGVMTAAFDVGMIMLWYGASNAVPAGWHVCDGTNGTPDMRDRFPVGAGSSYALNATGGATASGTGTTDSQGAHTHGGATGSTAIDISQMPAHDHGGGSSTISLPMSNDDNSQAPFTALEGSNQQLAGNASFSATISVASQGGGAGHTHTISSDGGHTHTTPSVATLPPYRALYYIMFIGF